MLKYLKVPIQSEDDMEFLRRYAHDHSVPICRVFYHMSDFYAKKKAYDTQNTVDELDFKKVMGIEL